MKTRFSTMKYEFCHGKKPRGSGFWAFNINGAVLRKIGPLSEAKKSVKAEFPQAGTVEVLP